MGVNRKQKITLVIAVLVALVVGGGVYAFTASNTVPTATVGSGAVSGYTVSNLHYNLNATTPANIDSLAFTITPAVPSSGSGKVVTSTALSSGGSNTYTCTTDAAGTMVTCSTTSPQLTAAALTGVTVVAQ